MHVVSLSAPALAIALIYAIWQRYFLYRVRQERILRERVAYLVWVVAKRACCQERVSAAKHRPNPERGS